MGAAKRRGTAEQRIQQAKDHAAVAAHTRSLIEADMAKARQAKSVEVLIPILLSALRHRRHEVQVRHEMAVAGMRLKPKE